MSIVTLAANLKTMRIEWGQQRYDLSFAEGDTGAGQSRIMAPPRWLANLVATDNLNQADAAYWRAMILSLNGRVNQIALYDLGNPAPRGTLRGAPTLNAVANPGDLTLNIVGTVGQTLLTGDWVGIGSGSTRQLLSVAADCTIGSATVGIVPIGQPVRYTQAYGSALLWDKPTALFRQTGTTSKWQQQGMVRGGYTLDLLESWE